MDYIQMFHNLWTTNSTVTWGKMLLVGLLFITFDLVFFLVFWFLRQEVAIEWGYPQRRRKYMKRKLASHTFGERITLLKLTGEAERKGFMLYVNIIFHWMNILAFVASLVGFVACMITLADGWALTLLVMAEIAVSFVTAVVELVPHALCLKSVRNKYR